MLLSTLTSISSYALFLPLCSPHRVIVLFLPTIKRPPATISALTGTTFALCSNDFQTPLQFLFGVLTEQQLSYSMLLIRVLNWSTKRKTTSHLHFFNCYFYAEKHHHLRWELQAQDKNLHSATYLECIGDQIRYIPCIFSVL